MPQLVWNELDFLECFEVEPSVLDEIVSHSYDIQRNGLRLLVTVWQLESVVQVTLYRDGSETGLFSFAAYVRGAARYINDQRGRYLEISDCIVAPNRFWYLEAGDVLDRERHPASLTIEIQVESDIRVAFVRHQSTT